MNNSLVIATLMLSSASAASLRRHHIKDVTFLQESFLAGDYMPERLAEYGKDIPEQVFAPAPETF